MISLLFKEIYWCRTSQLTEVILLPFNKCHVLSFLFLLIIKMSPFPNWKSICCYIDLGKINKYKLGGGGTEDL